MRRFIQCDSPAATIQKAIEGVEKASIKQSAHVHLDFDFVFQ